MCTGFCFAIPNVEPPYWLSGMFACLGDLSLGEIPSKKLHSRRGGPRTPSREFVGSHLLPRSNGGSNFLQGASTHTLCVLAVSVHTTIKVHAFLILRCTISSQKRTLHAMFFHSGLGLRILTSKQVFELNTRAFCIFRSLAWCSAFGSLRHLAWVGLFFP